MSQEPRKKVKTFTYFQQGIGYSPADSAKKEFKALVSEWEAKLAESGFKDIEYRTPGGYTTPLFKDGPAASHLLHNYEAEVERYYQLCLDFSHVLDFEAEFGPELGKVYKWLWYFHAEGVPYRSVANAFKGKVDKKNRNVEKVPVELQHSVSYFWAFAHTHRILDLFWQWLSEQGLKDPRAKAGTDLVKGLRKSKVLFK
jgi:hypothetical protein